MWEFGRTRNNRQGRREGEEANCPGPTLAHAHPMMLSISLVKLRLHAAICQADFGK